VVLEKNGNVSQKEAELRAAKKNKQYKGRISGLISSCVGTAFQDTLLKER
jgi:hypothetical protein